MAYLHLRRQIRKRIPNSMAMLYYAEPVSEYGNVFKPLFPLQVQNGGRIWTRIPNPMATQYYSELFPLHGDMSLKWVQ